MENQLNYRLIEVMTESLSSNINFANYLMDTLGISKEAAYRRIRGDVPFTLHEVAKIALKLNLSLDRLIGNNDSTGASINLNLVRSPDSIPDYNETLERYLIVIKSLKDDPDAILYSATNMLPFYFYAQSENIIKFRVCRWLHQTNLLKGNKSLKDIHIPQEVFDLHRQVLKELHALPKTIYIWDMNVFSSIIQELKYFTDLKLVSSEDILNIKKELLEALHNMEIVLSDPYFKEGGEIQIYLSNLSMEATYVYMEASNTQISMIRVFAINIIDTRHAEICRLQKDWLLSLRRYSTLITHSNERERLSFINKQREYINTL